jgi:uncharacterized protein (DUF2062 family)
MHWDKLAQFWHEVFLPYLVGSLGPALGAALLGYWISLPMIEAYHTMRARRREARARNRPESTRDSFTKEN